MAEPVALSAVEAFVLLEPNRARGPAAVKLAMLSLLAQGNLAMVPESIAALFGRRRTSLALRVQPKAWPGFPGAATLLRLVGQGCTMRQFVERARRQYGAGLRRFVDGEVRPALRRRGLVEPWTQRLLGIFPRTRWRATAAGEREVARINRAMAEARTIPSWLDRDPAQAAALAATLGTAILLVDELKPHYQRLSQAMREQQGGDATTDFSTISASGSATSPDIFCPGDFDFAAFDALDGGFDAFDAGFAEAGGDGGSDGGGGDGGGDGGGSGC